MPRPLAARANMIMLAIGALILLGIVSLSYREWQRYRRERADVARIRVVVEALDGLQTSLLDAETGQRGFLLTGEDRYLEPYNRAAQAVPAAIANLNALLSEESVAPEQRARLNSLVDQELTEVRRTVDLRRTQGAAPALAMVLSDEGKQVMDQIRALRGEIRAAQYSNLMAAQDEAESAARTALLITIIGSLVLLGFFVAGNRTINAIAVARERALAEAQNARDSLKTTLASIGDAVISTDGRGKIVFANKVAQSLLRAPESAIVGKHLDHVFRIVNELTRATVESPVAKVLREGSVVGLANHTVLIAQDGTEVPIDDSAAPIRSEDGTVQGTVLVFRDVTARREAESISQLLSSIVVSSEDAIVSKDLAGTITSWNRGAERMFGYSAPEMIGRSVSVLYPPEKSNELPEILGRVSRGERVEHYRTLRVTKDGTQINVSLSVSPVHDASGRIVGAAKIVRDITSQVRAQEEIAEQRERLRVTLNSIGDAVMATDGRGHLSFLNAVAEKLTGWSSAEAVGRPLEEVFRIVNERTRHTVENPVAKVLREGKVVGLANHTILIARDGKEIAIDDSAAPIRNDRGDILGVVLVFRDIAERRAAEKLLAAQTAETARTAQELREANAALSRANEDLQQFAYAASHDLQEPLRMITSYAQLLLSNYRGELDGEPALCVDFISRGTARMRELLSDLLAYTQVGAEAGPQAELVDLNGVLQKALDNLKIAIEETNATVQSESLPAAYGHESHFVQLFQNLISNGIKYRGERAPRIYITSKGEGRNWRVSVSDNGIGIDPEYHDRVFGVFKRLHGKRIPGTGIGLAICQRVVQRYGGKIWVESTANQGATFYFTLPVIEEEKA
jgi:PAS domain S-box-containing protein